MSWLPKKLIVVPLSFNDKNLEALNVALSMVDDPSHVHIVHVLPKLSAMEPGEVWGDVTPEKRMERTRTEIRKRLTAIEGGGERYKDCQIITRIGYAASSIAKYAKEVKAELIVLTSKGHSRTHNFFLGSTADDVFYETTCPILIIKK